MIRLDKYLADMGIGTRTEVKQLIKKGQVCVNGAVCKKPEQKVEKITDSITCQGAEIVYEKYVYYMLHKPAGYVSAVTDERYPTVVSLIDNPKGYKLFPAGRLDLDTEGLLLLTNDGGLAHELLSPRKHVAKTYYAKINQAVTKEDVRHFLQGVDIGDDKMTLPAKLEILETNTKDEILLTITEGRYHQVKRMFEAVGKKVLYLKRMSMGALQLDEGLEKGKYRLLTEDEIRLLKDR